MRIGTYNHLGGSEGKSLSGFLKVHAAHALGMYEQFEKYVDLPATMETLRQANVGVLGISEVIGKRQRFALQEALGSMGYVDFHVGQGHGLKGHEELGYVETLLATKMPSTLVYDPAFEVPALLGFGGGAVGAYIDTLKMYVVQVHLPLPGRKTRAELNRQMCDILKEIRRIQEVAKGARIVLMGDFNMILPDLVKGFPELAQFEKLSSDEPTCSMTNLLRYVYRKNIDHILGIGVQGSANGVIEGASDHALVWADVE